MKDWRPIRAGQRRRVAEYYGTTVESLGKRDTDFNANAAETEQFLRADREVMSSQRPAFITEEPATCARTGVTRWFQTVKVPLLSSDGGSRQVLGVATDITARKQLEDQFRQAQDGGSGPPGRRRSPRFQQRADGHSGADGNSFSPTCQRMTPAS